MATIEIDSRSYEDLERLARDRGVRVETLVGDAVHGYLARHMDRSALVAALLETVEAIRAGLPSDLDPAEIEAEITRAREAYRAEKRRHASSR